MPIIIAYIIKKELGVFLRVPGNDQQKTDLVNTLPIDRSVQWMLVLVFGIPYSYDSAYGRSDGIKYSRGISGSSKFIICNPSTSCEIKSFKPL